jgi:putative endonuclease
MATKELGDLGEKLACEYLVEKGFTIVGKNYRVAFGEIDIIAKKAWRLFSKNDKTIHFIEVKTIIDNNGGFFPEDHVDFKKRKKLRQMAQIWLKEQRYPQDFPHQIDVIGILVNKSTRNAKLHYFPNSIQDN